MVLKESNYAYLLKRNINTCLQALGIYMLVPLTSKPTIEKFKTLQNHQKIPYFTDFENLRNILYFVEMVNEG